MPLLVSPEPDAHLSNRKLTSSRRGSLALYQGGFANLVSPSAPKGRYPLWRAADVHFRFSNRLSIASNWFLLAQCVLCAFSRASARGSESSPDVGVDQHDSFNRGAAPHSTLGMTVRDNTLIPPFSPGQTNCVTEKTHACCRRPPAVLECDEQGCP